LHWCEKYKNRPRNGKVIVKNKAVPFYGTPCSWQSEKPKAILRWLNIQAKPLWVGGALGQKIQMASVLTATNTATVTPKAWMYGS